MVDNVLQPWGREPTWSHLEFKWGRPKCLGIDKKKRQTEAETEAL